MSYNHQHPLLFRDTLLVITKFLNLKEKIILSEVDIKIWLFFHVGYGKPQIVEIRKNVPSGVTCLGDLLHPPRNLFFERKISEIGFIDNKTIRFSECGKLQYYGSWGAMLFGSGGVSFDGRLDNEARFEKVGFRYNKVDYDGTYEDIKHVDVFLCENGFYEMSELYHEPFKLYDNRSILERDEAIETEKRRRTWRGDDYDKYYPKLDDEPEKSYQNISRKEEEINKNIICKKVIPKRLENSILGTTGNSKLQVMKKGEISMKRRKLYVPKPTILQRRRPKVRRRSRSRISAQEVDMLDMSKCRPVISIPKSVYREVSDSSHKINLNPKRTSIHRNLSSESSTKKEKLDRILKKNVLEKRKKLRRSFGGRSESNSTTSIKRMKEIVMKTRSFSPKKKKKVKKKSKRSNVRKRKPKNKNEVNVNKSVPSTYKRKRKKKLVKKTKKKKTKT